MSEVNTKSAITARNKRLKGERHAKRMAVQLAAPKVPRGTARNLRRKPLQEAYAKRAEKAAL